MTGESCAPVFLPNGLPENRDGKVYMVAVAVDFTSLFLNFLSIFLVITIDKEHLKKIYQGTLLSLIIGNFITCLFFTLNTISNFCQNDSFLTRLTMEVRYCAFFLTITHMFCLMSADYIVRNSRDRTEIKPVTGLLLLSWVMSICIGEALASTQAHHSSLPVAIITLLIFFGMVIFYMTVMRSLKNKILKIQAIRNYFLEGDNKRYSQDPRRRISKFPRLIILSSFSFCIPWCFIEAASQRGGPSHNLIHRYSDLYFSIQSQLIAIICLHLRTRVLHERQGRNFVSMKRKVGSFRKTLKHHSKENYELVLALTSPKKTQIEKIVAAQLAAPSPPPSARMSAIFLTPHKT